ncbi:MAG: YggS family pyridoxal phosphate-dependent enzyme [Bacillota bacterium]
MHYIQDNISYIKNEIKDICRNIGRSPDEIRLIAVTKTINIDRINHSIMEGITDIGENKVQEILEKYDHIHDVKWHLIGHLQKNKVKYIIDKVALIHSLDSISLAQEINKRGQQHGIIMDVLVQVNVANEETKFGIEAETVMDFIAELKSYPSIKVKGLMTIAPYEEEPENVRIYFRKLKNIFDEIKTKDFSHIDMQFLSMGMTNDYRVAIEEGANMIRIGTGIFGARNYR